MLDADSNQVSNTDGKNSNDNHHVSHLLLDWPSDLRRSSSLGRKSSSISEELLEDRLVPKVTTFTEAQSSVAAFFEELTVNTSDPKTDPFSEQRMACGQRYLRCLCGHQPEAEVVSARRVPHTARCVLTWGRFSTGLPNGVWCSPRQLTISENCRLVRSTFPVIQENLRMAERCLTAEEICHLKELQLETANGRLTKGKAAIQALLAVEKIESLYNGSLIQPVDSG